MNLAVLNTFEDLYANSKKVVCERKKEILIVGNEYSNTRKLGLKELKLFIERDIYLAIREGIIPKLNFEIKTENLEEGKDAFEVIVENVEGEVVDYDFVRAIRDENPSVLLDEDFLQRYYGSFVSTLGLEIQFQISKLLESYNRQEFRFVEGRFVSYGERFDFTIRFSPDYLGELLEAKSLPEDELVLLDDLSFEHEDTEVVMSPKELDQLSDKIQYEEFLKKTNC